MSEEKSLWNSSVSKGRQIEVFVSTMRYMHQLLTATSRTLNIKKQSL